MRCDNDTLNTGSLQNLAIEYTIIAKRIRCRVYDKSWWLLLSMRFGNVAQGCEFGRPIIGIWNVEVDVFAQSWYIKQRAIEESKFAPSLPIGEYCVSYWAYHDLVADRYRGLPCGAEDSDSAGQLTYSRRSALFWLLCEMRTSRAVANDTECILRQLLAVPMFADPSDNRIALFLLRRVVGFRGPCVFRKHDSIAGLQGQVSTYTIVRVHTTNLSASSAEYPID
jgi:hypothetical protein